MSTTDIAYRERIAACHRELSIPIDYAADRGLALQREADEARLVTIALDTDGTAVRLVLPAAAAWQRLQTAAGAAGIELMPQSGFRSVDRQLEIIREKLAEGRLLADILASVAAPGHSEHHTGRALDLGTPGEPELEEAFAHTPAFQWLKTHAAAHGFHLSYPPGNPHGFVFEPWHWCWHR